MKHFVICATLLLAACLTGRAYEGELLRFRIEDPKTYPGTSREIQVYVPKAYEGKTPACLLVRMDGWSDFFGGELDALIAEGSMPVTIGVFVEPGKIRDREGNVIRYNRSNEYDRVDGRFASFLEAEVLPKVEGLATSDGRPLKLSGKAADRAITGGSSGAICAFNVAWQRPDLFSRVYSVVGTYVPFRGGDQFPALVRKGETRPIRVFLQDNMDDTWNPLFGSWFEYNRVMLSALEFAGYDVRHQWNEGGHSGANGEAIFRDVMRWLWSGWPAAVPTGKTKNGALLDILSPDSSWEAVAEGVAEGSMMQPYSENAILLVTGKKASLISSDGEASTLKGKIPEYDPFTAVYPGGSHLARREEGSNWVWNYVLEDGKELYGQEFYYLYTDAGQILFDNKGYLYAATSVGIQICDQNGRVRAILPLPGGRVDSIAFAGDRLYALSGGRIYVRRLLRSGTHSGTPKSEGQG